MQSSDLSALLRAFAIASGAPLPAWEATHTTPVEVSEPGGNFGANGRLSHAGQADERNQCGHRWAPYGKVENGEQS
jgi:hypothetical protein